MIKNKKRIIVFLIVIVAIIIVFCLVTGFNMKNKKEKSVNIISDYNGIYKNNNSIIYVIATDNDKLEYYVIDELNDKNYGTLEFKNGIAINDDFDEIIKLRRNKNNLVVETENITNLEAGTYEKISDYTIDEYYEDSYGLSKYYGNQYTGKYINDRGTIYIYQPIKKYVKFISIIDDKITDCEVNLEEETDLNCQIYDTKYTIELDNDKLSYVEYDLNGYKNFEGIFTKENEFSKKEIINNFDPFTLMDEENN